MGCVVDRSGTVTDFCSSTSFFPCQYHSTNAAYPFIHVPPTLYNVFLPVLQFSPVYHSTSAPYPYIHLPPTLYNVFLPVLQFSLSVSFHQCSIPIHSPTTHAVYCFSPSNSVFPCQYHFHQFSIVNRNLTLLLSEGHAGEIWGHWNRAVLFRVSDYCMQTYFHIAYLHGFAINLW